VLKVLVVDADREARDLYRHWLASSHVDVREAVDGRDALVQIHAATPHVLVTDISLPYIDGLQLCALLRVDSNTASIRTVVIASDESAEQRERLHERGADVVLVKPVAASVLLSAIRLADPVGLSIDAAESGGLEAPLAFASIAAPRRALAKARTHERYVSTNPPKAPPRLRCPQCDSLLVYDRSHVGGVSDRHPEQWDYFVCATHGTFQYRHRTRKLRAVS
jgi:CheY-like chemotaxis protein